MDFDLGMEFEVTLEPAYEEQVVNSCQQQVVNTQPGQAVVAMPPQPRVERPSCSLLISAFIFCFFPLGFIASYYYCQSKEAAIKNDPKKAAQKKVIFNRWAIGSIVIGFLVAVVVVVLYAVDEPSAQFWKKTPKTPYQG